MLLTYNWKNAALVVVAMIAGTASQAATVTFDLGETNNNMVEAGTIEVGAAFGGSSSPVSVTDFGSGYTIDVLVGNNQTLMLGRTRTLDKTGGTFTLDDLYADFIIRVGGIELSNLLPNTAYDIEFIMYDDDEPNETVVQTVTNTTDGASDVIGQVSWDVNTQLLSNDAQRLLAAEVVSDGLGQLTFTLSGVGNGGNVLVNGVTVTQAIPEPSALVLMGLAASALVFCSRRRA
jgi:hypothetical protein